jgi:23S rRNA (pseudouridine1915-N3)-methyltransferase
VARSQVCADSRASRRPQLKVFLYYIGKPRDAHANHIAEDFIERAARYASTRMLEVRPDRVDLFAKHPSAEHVYLDPAGRALDSAAFSRIFEKAEMTGRDLVFLVGGADGLPPAWKQKATMLLSLSPMTFPHELARAVLAEQIYRAFAILRGHPYPR